VHADKPGGAGDEDFHAARFYDASFDVPRDLHAVLRNRRLAALAGAYVAAPAVDYGIAVAPAPTANNSALLLTATSRDDKLWPEDRWIALGRALHERGLACLLPAGSATERERAARIAQAIPGATVLPPMRLTELAAQLAAARIVVGVDTGLAHLAAALGRPVLALFSASDPALTGVLASTPAINLGSRGQSPGVHDVLAAALPLL
jgi:heptosyltransferase-1